MRPSIRAGGIAGGLWLALALSPARVFVTAWTRDRAGRVALVPDAAWLLASLVLTIVVASAVALAWRRRGGSFDDLLQRAAPLAALLVLGVPYLPLVADYLPALGVFAGPFRWLLVAAAIMATLWPLAAPTVDGLARHAHRQPRWLLLAGFLAIGTVGLWHTARHGLGGDEPHYLIITESLLRDGDLRIENNHDRRDYARFIDYEIAPDFLQRGRDDAIYSIHAPGLAVLVLPAYVVGGVVGTNLFLAFVAALTGLSVFRLARDLATPGVALASWAAVVLTTPFFVQGWQVFPEIPAACATAWSLWWLHRPDEGSVHRWVWRGFVVGSLPWLHTKFSVLLAGLAIALTLALVARRRWRAAVAFAVPVAASVVAWLLFFRMVYGVFDPTIAYGEGIAATYQLAWANVPRGVLGYLFDQEYGLLLYAPVYLAAAAGFVPLLRRADVRSLVWTSLITGVLFLIATTRYYMWWGGWSAPARFLVPVLPLAAPWLTLGYARLATHVAGRAFLAATLGSSLVVTALLAAQPGRLLIFNDRDGTGKLVEWLEGPAGLTSVLPSLLLTDWQVQLPRVLALVTAVGIALVLLWVGARRERDHRRVGALIVWLIVITVAAFSATSRPVLTREAGTTLVRDGQLALLGAWQPDRLFDVSRASRVSEAAMLERIRVPLAVGSRPIGDDPMRWLGPWPMPAGSYLLRVWLTPGAADAGDVVASFHRSSGEAARVAANGRSPVTLRFELPAGVEMPPLWLGITNPAIAQRVVRVDLEARAIVAAQASSPPRARVVENLPNSPAAYLAYLDDDTYPEGGVFWTRGESRAEIMIFSRPGQSLRLDAQTGDSGGTATFTVDGKSTSATLGPHGATSFEAPLSSTDGRVRVTIAFSGGFRPSDHGAADRRWLGLRVLPRLFQAPVEQVPGL